MTDHIFDRCAIKWIGWAAPAGITCKQVKVRTLVILRPIRMRVLTLIILRRRTGMREIPGKERGRH